MNINKGKEQHSKELIFKSTQFTQIFVDQILPKLSRSTISQIRPQKWRIDEPDQQWILVLKQVKSSKIIELMIFSSRLDVHPIQCIDHINFLKLKQLRLDNSNITNIQGLAHFDMPELHYLYLLNNQISSLKPVNKTKFTKLKQFGITKNRLSSFDMSRANLIRIESISSNGDFNGKTDKTRLSIQDLKKFIKLESQTLKLFLDRSSEKLILSKLVLNHMKKRFEEFYMSPS